MEKVYSTKDTTGVHSHEPKTNLEQLNKQFDALLRQYEQQNRN